MARTGRPRADLILTDDERELLVRWARRRKSSQALALRSRIVLECATGDANTVVAERLGVSRPTVGKWRSRFLEHRFVGLLDDPRPGWPSFTGSTCTSRRPTRHGSARSSASSPQSPATSCNAPTTVAFRRSRKTSAIGSRHGTTTRNHSFGPRVPTRSSKPSHDQPNEPTAQGIRRLSAFRFPVIPNVLAHPVDDPEVMKKLLVEQITSPVRWRETLETLASLNVDGIIEVGPGRVLSGLARQILPSVETWCTASSSELEKVLKNSSLQWIRL